MQTTTALTFVTAMGDLLAHIRDEDKPTHTLCGRVHTSTLHDGDHRLDWFKPCHQCHNPALYRVTLTDQPDQDTGALFGLGIDQGAEDEQPAPSRTAQTSAELVADRAALAALNGSLTPGNHHKYWYPAFSYATGRFDARHATDPYVPSTDFANRAKAEGLTIDGFALLFDRMLAEQAGATSTTETDAQ